ncbi:MAG TPA: prepilin-type N-terminal cleavage/methylation domain-containing protein [Dehalococcoidales bacterium]|nr:prepilin-type N-terminal cleavage/methylation domain-containing protein [Dehalococcoidales bacterium]
MIKNNKGFTLIEVLLAIALLGLIATALITGLATSAKGLLLADEREAAKNLAESQMEKVKEQPYIYYSVLGHDVYLSYDTPGYSVNCTAVPIDPTNKDPETNKLKVFEIDEDGVFVQDLGLQLITVMIKHNDKEVITIEGYKADR